MSETARVESSMWQAKRPSQCMVHADQQEIHTILHQYAWSISGWNLQLHIVKAETVARQFATAAATCSPDRLLAWQTCKRAREGEAHNSWRYTQSEYTPSLLRKNTGDTCRHQTDCCFCLANNSPWRAQQTPSTWSMNGPPCPAALSALLWFVVASQAAQRWSHSRPWCWNCFKLRAISRKSRWLANLRR